MTFWRVLLVLLLIGLAGLAGGYVYVQNYLQSPGPLTAPVTILIEPGSGSEKIAEDLSDRGVVAHPKLFRALAVINGQHARFQAGEYAFDPGVTPSRVTEKLVTGDVVLHQITIPEGLTSAQIVALLNNEPDLSGTVPTRPEEGSLLPETYRFHKGEARSSVIARMQSAMRETLTALWARRRGDLPYRTEKEAVTLASIVEKETGIASERSRVAGVYRNRLKIGMLLQADPTVSYGRYGGQTADKPITRADLKADTPYNSYLHPGLPPTPICNPGKASLAAVAEPLESDELFFVADGKGGHLFAPDLAGHQRNVAAYRRLQAGQ